MWPKLTRQRKVPVAPLPLHYKNISLPIYFDFVFHFHLSVYLSHILLCYLPIILVITHYFLWEPWRVLVLDCFCCWHFVSSQRLFAAWGTPSKSQDASTATLADVGLRPLPPLTFKVLTYINLLFEYSCSLVQRLNQSYVRFVCLSSFSCYLWILKYKYFRWQFCHLRNILCT